MRVQPASVFVQQINTKIQIGSEQNPEEVGHHQPVGAAADMPETSHRQGNQSNEEEEPKEGKQPPFQPEEKEGPKTVDDQLEQIQPQDRPLIHIVAVPYQIGGQAHHEIEDTPHNREDRRWRGEGRQIQTVEPIGAAQQGAHGGYGKGDRFIKKKGFQVKPMLSNQSY